MGSFILCLLHVIMLLEEIMDIGKVGHVLCEGDRNCYKLLVRCHGEDWVQMET